MTVSVLALLEPVPEAKNRALAGGEIVLFSLKVFLLLT